MNDIFWKYLNQFIVSYLDDILIYSLDLNTHEEHVYLVLSRLRDHCLYPKYEKCTFNPPSVAILSYIVSPDGISMDQQKVAAIQEWKPPTPIRYVDILSWLCKFLSSVY